MHDDRHLTEKRLRHASSRRAAATVEWVIWGGLFVVIATLVFLFILGSSRTRKSTLPVMGTVNNFTLTNQSGQPYGLADLRGHVWVADIIFTRCPGPCLKMSRQMRELQESLPASSKVRLVSLTTDPEFDTPAVFRKYDEQYKLGAQPERWSFLTGTKEQIARVAVDSLKFTAIEKASSDRESANDLFIHSTIFVLIDKQARMRGIFETTGEGIDFPQVKKEILKSIQSLEKES